MPKPATAPLLLPGRRRWKVAEARSVLAALSASELSLPEFASQRGLDPQRLRRWQGRLDRDVRRPARAARPVISAAVAPPAVIELRPSSRPSLWRAEVIEIVLASGVIVRVAETIDPATLGRLVAALERGC
jgi:hypothetical protein